jgi:hypothetical protein
MLYRMKKLSSKNTSVVYQARSFRSVIPKEYAKILGLEESGTYQIKNTLVLDGRKHKILIEKV